MKNQNKLERFTVFGSKLGMERIEAILKKLGNPEADLKVIHVAGTNGKGSVCRYVYEVLRACGYSVGIYTSPFVIGFNERIEVDGNYISDEDFDICSQQAACAAEQVAVELEDSPTEFEVLTAAAYLYFKQKSPDFVILEVGLGGSGDTTNVILNPLVTAITSISLDHTDRLGNTEAEIAADKAGIIKYGVPMIIGVQHAEARKVIASRAYELSAPLIDATKSKAKVYEQSLSGSRFSVNIASLRYDDITISMPGAYQIENAVVALTIIDQLRQRKYISTTSEAIRKGMYTAKMPGRFEVLSHHSKTVILDGAHNEDGAKRLAESICKLLPDQKIVVITAILKDKDISSIIRSFNQFASLYIATAIDNERALNAGELAAFIQNSEDSPILGVETIVSPKVALERSFELLDDGVADVLIVAGSLYLISELRKYL
ncbi:MAG: bifunctional folylpolyglutamate synthase/dihydrofolate synthase [Clostridiales Family XIII bacterium]|jgi:dihydrofolate synthase/folylpolyglutamate synthase|nr:bifunctional folylpolyglutamate synthase/dihydrofolate synthase [Clostridiales Family XIII bacterium]